MHLITAFDFDYYYYYLFPQEKGKQTRGTEPSRCQDHLSIGPGPDRAYSDKRCRLNCQSSSDFNFNGTKPVLVLVLWEGKRKGWSILSYDKDVLQKARGCTHVTTLVCDEQQHAVTAATAVRRQAAG